MRSHEQVLVPLMVVLCFGIRPCAAQLAFEGDPMLGEALGASDVRRLDMTVFPDGTGLPPGTGDVATGERLFAARCAVCHGTAAVGGTAPELAWGHADLTARWPDKTIGSYWPFATTLFDFVRRAMPLEAPGSLTDSEVYSLSAYLLHLNGLVEADAVLDAVTLPAVRMPNRDGFVPIDAEP